MVSLIDIVLNLVIYYYISVVMLMYLYGYWLFQDGSPISQQDANPGK